jgi:hypothetical protein
MSAFWVGVIPEVGLRLRQPEREGSETGSSPATSLLGILDRITEQM